MAIPVRPLGDIISNDAAMSLPKQLLCYQRFRTDRIAGIPKPDHINLMTYHGKWALITGASAGIGKAFAASLASKGANLVLVARRKERLDEIGAALASRHSVTVKSIAADLSDPLAPEEIARSLSADGVNIDILVSNAGYGLPGVFTESDWRAHRDFIELMVTSYAHLTRLILPGMIERGYGRIIQVASVAGLTPGSSGHTMYGASKAFLISFAQSLAAECDGKGVHVSALCPGFTYSEFHDVNDTRALVSQLPKFMFMQAEPVVEGALAAVEKGHVVYVPGAWNKFTAWLVKALPRPWGAAIMKKQSAKFRTKND